MAKDLVEILRESQNEIPYDLRALVDSHRHGNSYNPYRRWNTQGG
jgi:ATP-dependent RNA helicase DDX5/DBP2